MGYCCITLTFARHLVRFLGSSCARVVHFADRTDAGARIQLLWRPSRRKCLPSGQCRLWRRPISSNLGRFKWENESKQRSETKRFCAAAAAGALASYAVAVETILKTHRSKRPTFYRRDEDAACLGGPPALLIRPCSAIHPKRPSIVRTWPPFPRRCHEQSRRSGPWVHHADPGGKKQNKTTFH